MWLAERAPTTIISADSRQVYRGFDVGTAKPNQCDRAQVPHRGVDVTDPEQRYSAAAWAEDAARWIDEAKADDRRPIVVGGTGLYLRALFEGLFEEPPLDVARRDRLSAVIGGLDVAELRRWVTQLDPPRAHLGRTQLLRSIEIALLTGHPLTRLHRDRARVPRWRPRYLLVDPGPALATAIAGRIDAMLANGWPDEVQQLMETVPAQAPAWNATGYETVRQLVSGELTRAAAHERILIDTRQYGKRQRTWFRHQLPAPQVTTVNPGAPGWEQIVEAWSR